jgi:hypothetical protein
MAAPAPLRDDFNAPLDPVEKLAHELQRRDHTLTWSAALDAAHRQLKEQSE